MQISGIATSSLFRAATVAKGTSSAGTADVAQSPQDPALDLLKNAAGADADAIKARAKKRLDDAKQELEFLRRWNFDPDILARQAGRLAREVGAAAKDFASAMSTGSTMDAATATETAATAISAGQSAADPAAAGDTGEDSMSLAQKAYQDTMKDGAEQKAIAADDRRTLEEFKAVAQELKALLEEALRRMREQNNAGQNAITDAQKSGDSLNQAIQGLNAALSGSGPAGAPGIVIAIPASITI